MKVEVEYPIVLNAIPKRSTQHKLVVVKDVCVIDIPQYSLAEAHVVMKEHIERSGKNVTRVYRAVGDELYSASAPPAITDGRVRYQFGHRDNGERSLIFHSNSHAAAVDAVNQRCKKLKSAARTGVYPEGLYHSFGWATSFRTGAEPPPPPELPMLSDGTVTGFDHEEVDKARERFLADCAGVIMVGDMFMLRRPEPVYVVDSEYCEDAPRVHLRDDIDPRTFSQDDDAEEPSLSRMLFSVDDLDAARDFASEMWRLRTGNEVDAVVDGNRLEIVDGSFLKFDGEAASAANIARIMEDRFVESIGLLSIGRGWHSRTSSVAKLRSVELDSFAAFQDLSKALAEYEAGADGDVVCDAVRQALSTSGASRFLRESDMPMAELALGRWEKRHVRRDLGLFF